MAKEYGEATLVSGQLHGEMSLRTSALRGSSSLLSLFQGNASLIHSDDDIKRLSVSPKFLWLTESNNYSGIFRVKSNVDWKIE